MDAGRDEAHGHGTSGILWTDGMGEDIQHGQGWTGRGGRGCASGASPTLDTGEDGQLG